MLIDRINADGRVRHEVEQFILLVPHGFFHAAAFTDIFEAPVEIGGEAFNGARDDAAPFDDFAAPHDGQFGDSRLTFFQGRADLRVFAGDGGGCGETRRQRLIDALFTQIDPPPKGAVGEDQIPRLVGNQLGGQDAVEGFAEQAFLHARRFGLP